MGLSVRTFPIAPSIEINIIRKRGKPTPVSRLDINLAKEPILVPPDNEVAPSEADKKVFNDLAVRLFHETASSVVEVRSSHGTGSGFFVDDDGRVVTNYHVVKDSPSLTVMTTDAMSHPAKIEKIDDINDLALIRIDDAAKGKFKPLKLGDDLANDSKAFVIGHPNGKVMVHIAAGKVQAVTTQMEAICESRSSKVIEDARQELERIKREKHELEILLGRTPSTEPPTEDCRQRYDSLLAKLSPQQQLDGKLFLNRPAVPAVIPTFPGNSGGPLVGENGKVAGVARISNVGDPSSASFVPVSQVKEFLEGDSKFQFKYKYLNESPNAVRYMHWWEKEPATAGATTLGAVAVSGAALRFTPRWGLALGAIAGGAKLAYDDLEDRSYFDGGPRGNKELLSLGADASMILGGVMTAIPRVRLAGMAIATVASLGRIGTEFISTYPVLEKVTRADGSLRELFDSKVFGID